MFRFNFSNENIDSEKEERGDNEIKWYECKRVEIKKETIEKVKNPKDEEVVKLHYDGDITLTCLSPTHIITTLKNESGNTMSDILEAEKNHSDLIPGKYEGGLKVWECTRDLVNYLANNVTQSLTGMNVLDLGCGAGILGIVAALKEASVTFQDYNHEVIELITIPNVCLNIKDIDATQNRVEFFAGDWDSFTDCMTQNGKSCDVEKEPSHKKLKGCIKKFDYILSSETIYNPDNYVKLYRVIKECMKDDGVCYMAAKKCYFGVGGNTHCFSEYLKKENVFNIETCWSSHEGVAREILKITFRKRTEC